MIHKEAENLVLFLLVSGLGGGGVVLFMIGYFTERKALALVGWGVAVLGAGLWYIATLPKPPEYLGALVLVGLGSFIFAAAFRLGQANAKKKQ